MKRRFGGFSARLIVLVLGLGAWAGGAWANPKNEIYVMGDSLSDTGNFYALTGWFPPQPYAQRFSNGKVWAEYFAEELDVPLDSRAYGGAFVNPVTLPVAPGMPFSNLNNIQFFALFAPLPGIQEEVDELLAAHPEGLNPDALYVLWAGANEFFLGLGLEQPALLEALLPAAAEGLAATVCRLGAAGARHFAVANLPDLGLTPLAQSYGRGMADYISSLTAESNRVQSGTVRSAWRGVSVLHRDTRGSGCLPCAAGHRKRPLGLRAGKCDQPLRGQAIGLSAG